MNAETYMVNIGDYEQAQVQALHDFIAEHEGTICGVCGEDKWAQYPFCRSCSIRLQRMHLMRELKKLRTGEGSEDPLSGAYSYFRYWDLCRDFLVNRRRETGVQAAENDGH